MLTFFFQPLLPAGLAVKSLSDDSCFGKVQDWRQQVDHFHGPGGWVICVLQTELPLELSRRRNLWNAPQQQTMSQGSYFVFRGMDTHSWGEGMIFFLSKFYHIITQSTVWCVAKRNSCFVATEENTFYYVRKCVKKNKNKIKLENMPFTFMPRVRRYGPEYFCVILSLGLICFSFLVPPRSAFISFIPPIRQLSLSANWFKSIVLLTCEAAVSRDRRTACLCAT